MPAQVIGSPFDPRPDAGQPPVRIETSCAHCGQNSVVTLPWEQARRYIASLEARLAETMRQLPRVVA